MGSYEAVIRMKQDVEEKSLRDIIGEARALRMN